MHSIKLATIAALSLLIAQSLPLALAQNSAQQPASGTHSKWFGNDMNVSSPAATRTGLSGGAPSSGNQASFAPAGGLSPQGQMIPMQQFPIEDAATSQGKGSDPASATSSDSLVLTVKYFSDEPNLKAAYREACEQKAAHFNEPAYYYRKAAILMQMGDYQKAGQELKGLLADIPNNSDYHLAQAYCFFKLGQKTAAMDELGMAKFHNPRLPANISFQ